jgi:alpha-tubulin N-acetyltransferase 1
MTQAGVRFLVPDPTDHIATVLPPEIATPHQDFIMLINELGQASSRTQGLSSIITTYSSFAQSDCKLYILVSDDGRTALGFLKVGPRHLFLWDRLGDQHELEPLCLLDFFIYPQYQRKGYGRRLVYRMLREEGMEMHQMPIDRPSLLCLSFMKKHFGMSQYVVQANKFVVFDEFWGGGGPRSVPKSQPRTPVKRTQSGSPAVPQHARTPGAKRSGLNPITWLPYD